ncbi:MAG: hypothetical protein H6741_02255 [Alphaproteobacteria bacterium]|nr:hypothetical protein [Alphaproteobacteria bacterium]MCB9791526.1 hypothetical protein [Alphaproteobacteria bacterium]
MSENYTDAGPVSSEPQYSSYSPMSSELGDPYGYSSYDPEQSQGLPLYSPMGGVYDEEAGVCRPLEEGEAPPRPREAPRTQEGPPPEDPPEEEQDTPLPSQGGGEGESESSGDEDVSGGDEAQTEVEGEGEGEGEGETEGESEGESEGEGEGEGGGEGGEAAAGGGGSDSDGLAPGDVGYVPAPPARLGGVRPPTIENPPPMAPKKVQAIRADTGLSPDEHHDRLRVQVNKIGNMARRLQVQVVQRVEATANEVQAVILGLADRVPGQVASARSRIIGIFDAARADVRAAAENTLYNIEAADLENQTGIDTQEELNLTNLETHIADADADVGLVYTDFRGQLQTLSHDKAEIMRGVPANLDPAFTTTILSGPVAEMFQRDTSEDLMDYLYERRAVNMPSLVSSAYSNHVAGAGARADAMESEATFTNFATQFLMAIDPSYIVIEQTGTEDEETQTSQMGETRIRLRTKRERAVFRVEQLRDSTISQLDQVQERTLEQLAQVGRSMHKAMMSQSVIVPNGLRNAAPSFADAYRAHVSRLHGLFPKKRFFNLDSYWPKVAHVVDDMRAMQAKQLQQLDSQAAEAQAQVQKSYDEQVAGLHKMVASTREQISKVVSSSVIAMEDIGMILIDEDWEERGNAEEQSPEQVEEAQRQRTLFLTQLREQMHARLFGGSENPSISENFDTRISDYRTEVEGHRDNFLERAITSGLFASIDKATQSDVSRRNSQVVSAGDGMGTNETKMFKALLGISVKGLDAMAEEFPRQSGRGLRSYVYYELDEDSDDVNAARNLFNGRTAEAAEYLLESSYHWYGNDRELQNAVVNSLTQDELQELQGREGWDDAWSDLQGSLHGTDLAVAQARMRGDDQTAVMLRLEADIDKSRGKLNEQEILDTTLSLRQRARDHLLQQARAPSFDNFYVLSPEAQAERIADAGVSESDIDAFELKMLQGAAERHGQLEEGQDASELTRGQAGALFAEHVTRDVRVYVPNHSQGREGGRGGHYENRALSGHLKTALTDSLSAVTEDEKLAAQGSRFAFETIEAERKGMTEQRRERIYSAGADPAYDEARLAYERAVNSGDEAAIRAAETRLAQAETRHQTMLQGYARALGADEATLADPNAVREYTADRTGRAFEGDGRWSRQFGRELVLQGRPDLLTSTMVAVDESNGTHEKLLDMTYDGRSRQDFAELRQDYAREVAGDAEDLEALDRRLGTNGHEAWFRSELSGDDRQNIEIKMEGRDDNDAARASIALLRYHHTYEEIGGAGRSSMSGSGEADNLHGDHQQILALLAEASGGPALIDGRPNPAAFGEDGNIRLPVDKLDRFRVLTQGMEFRQQEYNAGLERQESFWTGLITTLATIAAIALLFVPGLNLIVAGVIGAVIAVAAGVATIAVKEAFRGERYGWEEMGTDIAMTAVDAATALAGAKLGGSLGKMGKLGLAMQKLGPVGSAMAREALTQSLSMAAHAALDENTWKDGIGMGLLRVAGGGLKGAFIGAVTGGISAGAQGKLTSLMSGGGVGGKMTAMQSLGRRLGENGTKVIADTLSGGLSAMASETINIGFEVVGGTYKGGFWDGIGRVLQAGGKDMLTGAIQSMGEVRVQRDIGRLRADIIAGRRPANEANLRLLQWAMVGQGEQDYVGAEGMGRLRAELELAGSASRGLSGPMRELMAALPYDQATQLRGLIDSGLPLSPDLLGPFLHSAQGLGLASLKGMDPEGFAAQVRQAQVDRLDAMQVQAYARAAVVTELPPHLQQRLAHLPMEQLHHLPPEGLAQVAELIKSRRDPTPREALELYRAAKAQNPNLDRSAFLKQLGETFTAARDARADFLAKRREGIADAPEDSRRALAALPDDAIELALSMIRKGELGSPHEVAQLARLAADADPNLHPALFRKALRDAVAATQARTGKERLSRAQERAKKLQDLPEHLRGAFGRLPPDALELARSLMLRGDPGTPRERVDFVAKALREDPSLDPATLLRQLDEAVSLSEGPRKLSSAERRAYQGELLHALPEDARAALEDTPILVVDDEQFALYTRSASGDAVTILVDGHPQVILRAGADPRVLREEGLHLLQSQDPDWKARVGQLDESKLANWDQLPLSEQLALYQTKIEIEIDAQERMLRSIEAEMGAATEDAAYRRLGDMADSAEQTLSNLRERLGEVESIGFFDRRAMENGSQPKPEWLDQPARLFSKGDGVDLTLQQRIDENTGVLRGADAEADMAALRAQLHAQEDADLSVQQRIEATTGIRKDPQQQAEMDQLRSWYKQMEETPVTLHEVVKSRIDQMQDASGVAIAYNGQPWGYGINGAFQVAFFEHGVTQITMRVQLKPEAGVTEAGLEQLRQRTRAGLDKYYNGQQHVVPMPDGRPSHLQVEVEFVGPGEGAHLEVAVHPGDGRAHQSKWYVEGHAVTHAHELSHQLGLLDEYQDGPDAHGRIAIWRQLANSPGVRHDHGIMTDFWLRQPGQEPVAHPLTHVPQRNLDQIMGDVWSTRGLPVPAHLHPDVVDAFREASLRANLQPQELPVLAHPEPEAELRARHEVVDDDATPVLLRPDQDTVETPVVRDAEPVDDDATPVMLPPDADTVELHPTVDEGVQDPPTVKDVEAPELPKALAPDKFDEDRAGKFDDDVRRLDLDDDDLDFPFGPKLDFGLFGDADFTMDHAELMRRSEAELDEIQRQEREARDAELKELYGDGSHEKAKENAQDRSDQDFGDVTDPMLRLRAADRLALIQSMTLAETLAIMRARKDQYLKNAGKPPISDADFEALVQKKQIRELYAKNLRLSPFSSRFDMVEVGLNKSASGSDLPALGVAPLPPKTGSYKPKSLTDLSEADLKRYIEGIRKARHGMDDELREELEALSDIAKKYADNKDLVMSEADTKRLADLMDSLLGQHIGQNPILREVWEEAVRRITDAKAKSKRAEMAETHNKDTTKLNEKKTAFEELQTRLAEQELRLHELTEALSKLAEGSEEHAALQKEIEALRTDRAKTEVDLNKAEAGIGNQQESMYENSAAFYSEVRGEFGRLMRLAFAHLYKDHPDWFNLNDPDDHSLVHEPVPGEVEVHHILYKKHVPERAVLPENLILALRNKEKGGLWQLHDLLHQMSSGRAGGKEQFNILLPQIRELLRRWMDNKDKPLNEGADTGGVQDEGADTSGVQDDGADP